MNLAPDIEFDFPQAVVEMHYLLGLDKKGIAAGALTLDNARAAVHFATKDRQHVSFLAQGDKILPPRALLCQALGNIVQFFLDPLAHSAGVFSQFAQNRRGTASHLTVLIEHAADFALEILERFELAGQQAQHGQAVFPPQDIVSDLAGTLE